MGLPVPSPAQVASLTALKAVADAGVAGADEKMAAIQSAIDVQQDAEDFQKSTFDVLNDSIIRKYEFERRYIDGQLLNNPIVEADLTSFSEKNTASRIWNGGAYEPARIAEFDGTPLTYAGDDNEVKQFEIQDTVIEGLENGYPGQVLLDVGAKTTTPLTPASTTVDIELNVTVINPNDVLLVLAGLDFAILKVTSAIVGGSCAGDTPPGSPDEATCLLNGGVWTPSDTINFDYIIEPSGTIAAGADIGQKTYTGFTNAERTAKVASDGDLQVILDYLLQSLMDVFNERLNVLAAEIQAIDDNQNDLIAATAKTNAEASVTAVEGFLGVTPPSTIDISDTGLTAINNEKTTRSSQLTARITEISNEIIAGDGENFYDKRFNTASGRSHLANGSITILRELNEAKASQLAGKGLAQGLSTRYAGLIP